MTPIEVLERKINLKFQYIALLGENIDETRNEIRELQDQLADIKRKERMGVDD